MANKIWTYDDGGRSQYYKASSVGDCVTRAIAIATQMDYKETYKMVSKYVKEYPKTSAVSARNGVPRKLCYTIMEDLGWTWHPTMKFGSGCKVHLKADELPSGRIICNCSKHLTAVIDGVIHDTYDPSREGTRCVYGYWYKEGGK